MTSLEASALTLDLDGIHLLRSVLGAPETSPAWHRPTAAKARTAVAKRIRTASRKPEAAVA